MLRFLYHKLLNKLHISGRDLTFFMLSLLLAFVIWLVHNLSLDYSAIVGVPVVAESNIEGHALYSSNSNIITARCRTSGYHLLRLARAQRKDPVTVKFMAKNLHHSGEDEFTISATELGAYVNDIFGEEISLESFVSQNVQFRFPVENSRKVPVQAVHVLEFRPQYMAVGPVAMTPDSVVVYGDPTVLENIDRVLTEPISHENIKSSIHGVAKLEVPAAARLSDSEVNYSVDVSRYVEIRDNVKIRVLHAPAGKEVSVYPSTADVVYKCAFPLSKDPSGDVYFYVDYNEFATSINGRCVARISAKPRNVIDYQIEPQVFECIENIK